MNDTPRTNAMLTAILETHGHVGFLNCPPAWVAFARELERELNAANEMFKKLNIHALDLTDRIKRLEEAGDALTRGAGWMGMHEEIENWRKAREDKL